MKKVLTILLILAFMGTAVCVGHYSGNLNKHEIISVDEIGVQLASQATVIHPSYMTYNDQTRLEKGTGLAGVDFLYVEKKTGIDAIFLMAVARHESSAKDANGVMVPGTNYWSKNYNNIMSLGITTVDPDRTVYTSKTMNVLVTAQWLLRAYLTPSGAYYHGGLTQWEIGKSYAWDGSWALGVTNAINYYEGKLSETQRMKRFMVKTETFRPDVVWDYVHTVVGWSLYKVNNSKVIAGR